MTEKFKKMLFPAHIQGVGIGIGLGVGASTLAPLYEMVVLGIALVMITAAYIRERQIVKNHE